MKRRGIAVIAFLVLTCSSAVAGSWSFGFMSVEGGLFCNYEQINNNNTGGVAGISNGAVYEGFDNLSACGISYNATLGGFGPYTPPKGVTFFGYTVHVTKGAVLGDNIYDTFPPDYTGVQFTIITSLSCSPKPAYKNKDWYLGVASFSNFVFGDTAGPLSCEIPVKGKHNGLLITGQAVK